jgi:hypothetical protein
MSENGDEKLAFPSLAFVGLVGMYVDNDHFAYQVDKLFIGEREAEMGKHLVTPNNKAATAAMDHAEGIDKRMLKELDEDARQHQAPTSVGVASALFRRMANIFQRRNCRTLGSNLPAKCGV